MSVPIDIKVVNNLNDPVYLNVNSESGWYIDEDGDLIFVLTEDDRNFGDSFFAFVLKNCNFGVTSFLVRDSDIEDVLYSPVRRVTKMDIDVKAMNVF